MEDKSSKAAFPTGNIFKELGQAEVGCRAREAGNFIVKLLFVCLFR